MCIRSPSIGVMPEGRQGTPLTEPSSASGRQGHERVCVPARGLFQPWSWTQTAHSAQAQPQLGGRGGNPGRVSPTGSPAAMAPWFPLAVSGSAGPFPLAHRQGPPPHHPLGNTTQEWASQPTCSLSKPIQVRKLWGSGLLWFRTTAEREAHPRGRAHSACTHSALHTCNAEAQAAWGVTPCWPVAFKAVPLYGSQDSAYYRTYRRQLRPSSQHGPRRPPQQATVSDSRNLWGGQLGALDTPSGPGLTWPVTPSWLAGLSGGRTFRGSDARPETYLVLIV